MKNFKLCYYTIFLLLVIGCNNFKNNEVLQIEKIDINEGFKKKEKLQLSSIAKEIKYIPLETKDECLIGSINKILFFKNLLFIKDDITKTLFIFDDNGKFVRKIGSKGKGPGEYIFITDFTVMPKDTMIFLYDGVQQRLIKFLSNGTFVQQYYMSNPPRKLSFWNDSMIVLAYPYPDFCYNGGKSLLVCTNSLLKFTTKLNREYENISIQDSYSIPSTSCVRLEYYCDSLTYWEYKYDTIYRIKNNEIMPRYVLLYDNKIPHKIKDINNGFKQDFTCIRDYVEAKNYIFFMQILFKNKLFQIMYNKKTHEVTNIFFEHKYFYEGGFYNDIDGGWPFLPMGTANDDWLYDVFSPSILNEFITEKPFINIKYSNIKKREELDKILINSNLKSNPVVMLVKLK
jgi:hypothetical protein